MTPKFRIETRQTPAMYYRAGATEPTTETPGQADDILTDADIAEVNASLKRALAVDGEMPPHEDRCASVKTILLPYDRE